MLFPVQLALLAVVPVAARVAVARGVQVKERLPNQGDHRHITLDQRQVSLSAHQSPSTAPLNTRPNRQLTVRPVLVPVAACETSWQDVRVAQRANRQPQAKPVVE